MNNIEIVFPYEGLEDDIKSIKQNCQVEIEFNAYSNFDVLCSVIGTAVNVGMFIMQAYSLWGNKRVRYISKDFKIDDVALDKLIDYLKNNNEDK